jgi:hypothetical protein
MGISGSITPANNPNASPVTPSAPAKYLPSRAAFGSMAPTAPIPVLPQGGTGPDAPGPGAGPQERESEARPKVDAWTLAQEARADKLLRQRTQALRAEENRVKAEREEIEQWRASDRERRENPSKLLRDYGFVPEAVLQHQLQGERLTSEQKLAVMEERLAQTEQHTAEQFQELAERTAREQREAEAKIAKRLEEGDASAAEADAQELRADIADVIATDADRFKLLVRAGERAAPMVYERLHQLSDEEFQATGRRPPITTRLIERAVLEVQEAALEDYRRMRADVPDLDAMAGLAPAPYARTRIPQTLQNALPREVSLTPPGGAPPAGRAETENERRARMIATIDRIRQRRG